MAVQGVIVGLTEILCGLSAILFTFIATFSRSEKLELTMQKVLFYLLLASAASLWGVSLTGGTIWGDDYIAQPLSLICIVLAISARLNIKGKNVSFGANPHSIGRKEEE